MAGTPSLEAESSLNSRAPGLAAPRSFALNLGERRALLTLGDVLWMNVALVAMLYARGRLFAAEPFTLRVGLWFVILSVLWLLISSFLDVYDITRLASPPRSAWVAGVTGLIASAIYILIPRYTPDIPQYRLDVLLFPALAALLVSVWHLLAAAVFGRAVFHHRSLIIGTGAAAAELTRAIAEFSLPGRSGSRIGYDIIGYVGDNGEQRNARIGEEMVLGGSKDLNELVEHYRPHELVLAVDDLARAEDDLFESILDCRERGVPIVTMTGLYERITGRVPVEHAGLNLPVVMPVSQSGSLRFYQALAAVVDRAVALAGCLLLALVAPWIWLANRLTSPGDLFYRQVRVGAGGRPFEVLKFRSMTMDAEKFSGAVWAEEDDPRITPAGRFLRRTRLDELPQVWNILRGEMGLVGPRPERPEFVEDLSRHIPFYRLRHAVKPGLTGWAQVKYPYGASVEDSLVKLQYDLYYIKHRGVYLDLNILVRTVLVVLGMRGR